jgi:Dinucleotide-utilizing enzymes involved in molybdopterin and thiamine biosynthesis family 2
MALFMKINICIIGCGGTGGNLIARLARFLSGYTDDVSINMAIADGDTVEYKNVARQPFDGGDLGENKAVVLAENIEACFGVRLDSFPDYILKTEDIERIFRSLNREGNYVSSSSNDINILVSCVDNHAARKICHDWFEKVSLRGTTFYIDPANEDVSGEVVIAKRNTDIITSPDRFWYYPEIINDLGRPVNEMSCEELNNAAPQHFATNCYAADICFAFIAGVIMCRDNAPLISGGITYFHAFKMFQRFYVCEYNEEEQRYVREA